MRARLLFLLLLACGPCRADKDAGVAPINVVHSWNDLLATRPLTLEDDNHVAADDKMISDMGTSSKEKVWIGIDRNHAPSKSAVVVYCASQGVVFKRTSPYDLGPFRVVIRPSPVREEVTLTEKPLVPENFQGTVYVLASFSLPLNEAGDYVIELDKRQAADAKSTPKVLARTTVHVAGKPVIAWLPWDEPEVPIPTAASQKDDAIVNTNASNPATGFAVPKTSPDARFYPAGIVPYMALPQLVPNDDNVRARLSLDGNTLLLEAGDMCWPQPKERCLTRWWVNGQPFVPAKDATDFQRIFQGSNGHSLDDIPSAIRFHMVFLPDRLAAKKGDKIGVQMLYCPSGIDRCAVPGAELFDTQFTVPERPPENFSSLSNRVDFIYSGDPMNPIAP